MVGFPVAWPGEAGGRGALSALSTIWAPARGFVLLTVSLWIRTRIMMGSEEVRDEGRLCLDREQIKSD